MNGQQTDKDQLHVSPALPGSAAMTPFQVGAVLREARENSGMSIGDVATRLKFSPGKITALEEGDFSKLQGTTFVRGFVRSYARLLQLDEEPLLDALPGASENEPVVAKKDLGLPFPDAYAARRSNILWLVLALLVALALGMFVWRHDRNQPEPETGSNAVNASLPASAVIQAMPGSAPANVPIKEPETRAKIPTAAVANEVVKKLQPASAPAMTKHVAAVQAAILHLACDEDSWIEVRDSNETVLLSQMCLAGSERTLNRAPPYSVVIGNARGVRLYFRGDLVDLSPHTRIDVARLTLE